MKVLFAPAAPDVRGPTIATDFTLLVEQTPTISWGGSGTETVDDVTYTTQVNTGSNNNFRINPLGGALTNETPSVCSLNTATGEVSRISDGLASIRLAIPGLGARRHTQQLVNTEGATVRTGVQAIAAGSLLKYLTDQRNAVLSQFAADASNPARRRAYVNADGSGGANPNQMLLQAAAGFTPITLTPLLFNAYRWITPKHRIFAYHTNPYWHNGASGAVATAVPLVYRNAASNAFGKDAGNDIGVVYETGANVAAENICKILPANWRSYLPTQGSGLIDLPVWVRRRWVGPTDSGELYWIQAASLFEGGYALGALYPADAAARQFAHPTNNSMGVGGDSGSPVFLGINGAPILLSHVWSYGGWFKHYADSISTINAALQATAQAAGDPNYATYAALTADLSAFNAYP